jgi:hypothetical protein
MISGKYSLDELKDLLVAKDQEMVALEKAWRAFDPTWMGLDSAGDNAWLADFNALKARYAAARTVANAKAASAVDTSPSRKPDNEIVADAEYRGVLSALQKQSGLVSPGDLQDLWNRLQGVQNAHAVSVGQAPAPIAEAPVWQPGKGSDVDENRLKMADSSIAGAVAVAMAQAGLIPDPSNPYRQPPPGAKKTGIGTWLVLGGGLTLAGIAAVKIAWKVAKPF